MTVLGRAILSGTTASITSALALATVARAEGRGALQPINATSHWLNGPQAAARRSADVRHTVIGYATHHAATIFWAVFFEWWIARRRPAGVALARDAVILSAIAAAVDYGPTPKRFTPGWELVLTKRGMAVVYAAMAAGLVIGVAAQRR